MKINVEKFGLIKSIIINEGDKIGKDTIVKINSNTVSLSNNQTITFGSIGDYMSDKFFEEAHGVCISEEDLIPFINRCDIAIIEDGNIDKIPLTIEGVIIYREQGYLPVLTPILDMSDKDLYRVACIAIGYKELCVDISIIRELHAITVVFDNYRVHIFPDKIAVYKNKVPAYTNNMFEINRFLMNNGYDVYNWIPSGLAFNKKKIR